MSDIEEWQTHFDKHFEKKIVDGVKVTSPIITEINHEHIKKFLLEIMLTNDWNSLEWNFNVHDDNGNTLRFPRWMRKKRYLQTATNEAYKYEVSPKGKKFLKQYEEKSNENETYI